MAFDAWMYRDPMEVAMRRQSAAQKKRKRQQERAGAAPRCAGCKHEMKLQMPAGEVGRCALGHRYGWRCVVFEAKGSQ